MRKPHTLLLSVLGLFMAQLTSAQLAPRGESTGSLGEQFSIRYQLDRKRAEAIAKERNIPLRYVDAMNRVVEFSSFDARGRMQFNITDNVGAGRTISTNKVWPGGVVGTSLTGVVSGARLGEWDGGAVLTGHQEFGSRVTQADGAFSVIDHATHVAGTMIAAGVDTKAKGMAYQASLRAYDWSDDASEMSSAAANGMLISNHSYGTIAGWFNNGSQTVWFGDPGISSTEDYRFGFYDYTAAAWDQIVVQNPYYLICKSAGNDRGEGRFNTEWQYSDGTPGTGSGPPADGQYDCISTYGVAKNILTVGAVRKIGNSNTNNGWTQTSDVVMSSFSGWGPADDGRIKPDVVGCGVSVYSSLANSSTAYGALDGTSMATPNVSGSLLLVQQHYNNLKGKFMLAASLKALAIHTADEAGSVGPDYQYGWGLVNIAKAVTTISDTNSNFIGERTLANKATYTQTISSPGNMPLRVTICWTDPAGTPASPSLDPSNKMLVNDLDLRVKRLSDDSVFYPYRLDKNSPATAATLGDNSVDNVEQVYIQFPQAGAYSIIVTHKLNLQSNAAQPFSVIVSGQLGRPVASMKSNTRAVCTGGSVAFTDNSSGSPTSRMWYFPGGTPATSTAASVNVTYNTPGVYPVSLRVTNLLGMDSITRTGYITVDGFSLPFTETFESNSASLSSWSIVNPNTDTTWRLATVGGTTPGNTAYCMPFFNYAFTNRRDGLVTPALNFKGFSTVNLSLQHAYTRDVGGASDSLVIWISTDCGNNYTRILSSGENGTGNFRTVSDQASEFIPASASDWCSGTGNNCISLDLTAYAGMSNVKIKFEGFNKYSNNLFIDNVTITGVPLPPVANFFTPNKTVCANTPVNFKDSTTNFVTQWKWTFSGASNPSSGQQHPTVSYPAAGVYDVKLVVTNSSGSDSITKSGYITVLPSPGKPAVSHTKPLTFCEGDSVDLNCDSAGTAYDWKKNGVSITGGNAASVVVKESGKYTVHVSNASGCSTASDSITVTSNTLPAKPTITSNLQSGFMCTGGTATLTSSATTGNQWYRNLNPINGANQKTTNVQDSGNYTVQVTNLGCKSEMSEIRAIALLVAPVTSEIQGKDSSIQTRTETYSVTSTVGSTYAWTITGGTKSSGGNSATIQVKWNAAGNGTVTVQESSNNGCKGILKSKTVAVASNAGLNDPGTVNFSLYPNPASGRFFVRLHKGYTEPVVLRMINTLGQLVLETSITPQNGADVEVNLGELQKGIYWVEIRSGNTAASRSLLVH